MGKEIKRRKDSFFGLHFDCHCSPQRSLIPIGHNLKEEDIAKVLKMFNPDYIQVDCKGHPGWASYPSKLGNSMPNIEKDPLMMFRKVTKEYGVALYVHYSGVWDGRFCTENPDEALLQADGTRHKLAVCLLGKYDDTLMIPQLIELATKYEIDGAWIDGECWGIYLDYDSRVIKAFEKETGIDISDNPPKNREDAYYNEYVEFNRELFRRHLRKCADAVHSVAPDFQFCSNWAFSDHMPEEVSANVDFLSGDFDPVDSVTSSRYAARALERQKYTWDLMAWGFRNNYGNQDGFIFKEPPQLMQEASSVISLGGGFQVYIPQYTDCSLRMDELNRIAKVSKFVNARRKFCKGKENGAEIALLLSTTDRLKESSPLYSRSGCEKIKGLTNLLLDSGYSVRYIFENDLYNLPEDIKCVVVPELYFGLREDIYERLFKLPKKISLLLVGTNTISLFAGKGIIDVSCDLSEQSISYVSKDDTITGRTKKHAVLTGNKWHKNGYDLFCEGNRISGDITVKSRNVSLIGFDIGTDYLMRGTSKQRSFIKKVLNKNCDFDVRLAKCEGIVEINILTSGKNEYLFITNMNGNHRSLNIATEEYITPAFNVCLSVLSGKEPKKVLLQPENKQIEYSYVDGRIELVLDKVEMQSIIQICK